MLFLSARLKLPTFYKFLAINNVSFVKFFIEQENRSNAFEIIVKDVTNSIEIATLRVE